MFPVSSYETAPDGRDFSLAAARPDTQPAGASHSQQIRKFRMLTYSAHGSYIIVIRQSGKRLSHRLLHVPFCPLYRKRTYRLVASLSGHLRNPCSKANPAPAKPHIPEAPMFLLLEQLLHRFGNRAAVGTAGQLLRSDAHHLPMSDGALAPTCSIMAFRALSSSTPLI